MSFGVKSKTSMLILCVCVCVCSCPDLWSEIEDASARFTDVILIMRSRDREL